MLAILRGPAHSLNYWARAALVEGGLVPFCFPRSPDGAWGTPQLLSISADACCAHALYLHLASQPSFQRQPQCQDKHGKCKHVRAQSGTASRLSVRIPRQDPCNKANVSSMRDLGSHDRIHRILPNHAIKQRILRCWTPGSHRRIRRILHNDAIKISF